MCSGCKIPLKESTKTKDLVKIQGNTTIKVDGSQSQRRKVEVTARFQETQGTNTKRRRKDTRSGKKHHHIYRDGLQCMPGNLSYSQITVCSLI